MDLWRLMTEGLTFVVPGWLVLSALFAVYIVTLFLVTTTAILLYGYWRYFDT